VRDAAGEPPDRFHLLGLAQLAFEAQPLVKPAAMRSAAAWSVLRRPRKEVA